jgi:CheY-like chemotaxis protein
MDKPFAPGPVALAGMCLVVEDDSIIRLDIEETLRGFGFRPVVGASTLESAAELAAAASLRFAVLDYEVGRGNTVELAETLAARGVASVFLTAHGHDIELPDSLRHIQVIAKPFTSSLLAEALLMALRPEELSCESATG